MPTSWQASAPAQLTFGNGLPDEPEVVGGAVFGGGGLNGSGSGLRLSDPINPDVVATALPVFSFAASFSIDTSSPSSSQSPLTLATFSLISLRRSNSTPLKMHFLPILRSWVFNVFSAATALPMSI